MMELPFPLQLVIDDVGWREGWDVSAGGGPFRAGVNRLLGPDDYEAVAAVGRGLNVRPQCAVVLCEWDRENVCAEYPTTTVAGRSWNNTPRIGPWLERSVEVFRRLAPHLELAMHGVGHEHWDHGVRTRAEWLGQSAAQRWPRHVLQGHLDCFRRILRAAGDRAGTYLARNMAETCSQRLHCRFGRFRQVGRHEWEIDATEIPARAYDSGSVMPAVLRVRGGARAGGRLRCCGNHGRVLASWAQDQDRFYAVGVARQSTCRLCVVPDDGENPWREVLTERYDTSDILGMTVAGQQSTIRVRCYGAARLDIAVASAPTRVWVPHGTQGRIAATAWEPSAGRLRIDLRTPDIQGEEIAVHIHV